ncbi:hypothetical protein MVEN_01985000 [Mycena venus]|uniref:Uncharacterized protein n=1 Tax=Mycena venus TaxID=2733690 RepID=A0A8H7CK18_9AGAR|nr:hypothetical protein MVEN_01985000 [Mycena venus]
MPAPTALMEPEPPTTRTQRVQELSASNACYYFNGSNAQVASCLSGRRAIAPSTAAHRFGGPVLSRDQAGGTSADVPFASLAPIATDFRATRLTAVVASLSARARGLAGSDMSKDQAGGTSADVPSASLVPVGIDRDATESAATDLGDAPYVEFIRTLEENPDAEYNLLVAPPGLMMRGYIQCALSELLPAYLDGRTPRTGDDPERDLDALHPRHATRRSMRIYEMRLKKAASLEQAPSTPPHPSQRFLSRRLPHSLCPEMEQNDGELLILSGGWRDVTVTRSTASLPSTSQALATRQNPPSIPRFVSQDSASKVAETKKTHRGRRRPIYKWDRIVYDSCSSSTCWQGSTPPIIACQEIDRLYYAEPRARGLHPYLKYFYPVPYLTGTDPQEERGTIFVDRTGAIFMYRSFQSQLSASRADEIEHAHNVLVGNDLECPDLAVSNRNNPRGPHLPIIIGYHRQSAVEPDETRWHKNHRDRVETFRNLPIVICMIGLVRDIVTILFPGIAARFLADAQWHKGRYGIAPMFGLFWNLCLNACFRGRRRIHCGPHADRKNQIGVCVLLIYVLKGFNFNHSQRTWLVIWEAGFAVQLPPWTLAIYPSALFYHFNVDVDEIEFATTAGNVRPTRGNSRPIVDGDDRGRGSFAFFNQSTMRQGPATGYDTIKEAKAHGLSGVVDFGESIQEAFERHLVLQSITPID